MDILSEFRTAWEIPLSISVDLSSFTRNNSQKARSESRNQKTLHTISDNFQRISDKKK